MHKLGPTGFHRNFDFGNHDDSQQICNLSRKGAKIRNQYNQVTHPTQDTTLESDKNTIKHHKNSESDQDKPQSQTADKPMALQERAKQPSRDTRKTE